MAEALYSLLDFCLTKLCLKSKKIFILMQCKVFMLKGKPRKVEEWLFSIS